ncbi:hypothetical protein [Rhizobium leguminosarum]
MRRLRLKRRDYSTEQIHQIAFYIFYPVFEAVPEIESFTGFQKRHAALAKTAAQTANDQTLEFVQQMGILFLTMARHSTKGIKLSRAAYEYTYRTMPIHSRVAQMVRAQRSRWPESEPVFPLQDPAKPRENCRKGLARFKALPDVPDYFQLYDVKRTAISLMLAGHGVSHEDISHYVDSRLPLVNTGNRSRVTVFATTHRGYLSAHCRRHRRGAMTALSNGYLSAPSP